MLACRVNYSGGIVSSGVVNPDTGRGKGGR